MVRGSSPRDAVVDGLASSAGVVTSAALIMVAVFSIFTTMSLVDLKILGVGTAAAALIDATVVRGILLPAALALLGDHSWYAPRWLRRPGTATPFRPAPDPAALQPTSRHLRAASSLPKIPPGMSTFG